MQKLFSHLFRCRVLLLLLPLLLSGCVLEPYLNWQSLLPSRVVQHEEVVPDRGRPAVNETSATPERQPELSVESRHSLPDGEQQLLPPQFFHLLTEELFPLPPAVSSKPPTEKTKEADSPRPVAVAPTPTFVYVDALLTEDVTWHGEVMVRGVVTVAPQATLFIDAGTVIRLGSTKDPAKTLLLVQGRIAATGTAERPILFTSGYAEPVRGDWQGIVILGSEKKNLFEHCRLEGAETGIDASYSSVALNGVLFSRCTTGARLQDVILTANGTGSANCDIGVSLVDSEADLRDPFFSGNRYGVLAERSSLYQSGGAFTGNASAGIKATDSRISISNGKFAGNGLGVELVSCQGSISGCNLAANADCGISLAGSRVKVYGNNMADNDKAGLKVEDGRGAAWGNSFAGNGGYDIVNAGSEDFRAMGNWWGNTSAKDVNTRIYDRQKDGRRGNILYVPVLKTKPRAVP